MSLCDRFIHYICHYACLIPPLRERGQASQEECIPRSYMNGAFGQYVLPIGSVPKSKQTCQGRGSTSDAKA